MHAASEGDAARAPFSLPVSWERLPASGRPGDALNIVDVEEGDVLCLDLLALVEIALGRDEVVVGERGSSERRCDESEAGEHDGRCDPGV